jgi:uncharacterized protein (TIGR00255 family)
MIASMTGYGRGEATSNGITVGIEIRSVNSRFLEVSTRLPRSLGLRENDIKDFLRQKISRGKINVFVTVEREADGSAPLKINPSVAKAYYALLKELRRTLKVTSPIRMEHLLQFSDIFEPVQTSTSDEKEWEVAQAALREATGNLDRMRRNEGGELEKDFKHRIGLLDRLLDEVEVLSRGQVPSERARLRERIKQLLEGENVDEGRLELELAILADRLDVTEECVRFRSHNKFFLEALQHQESAGRKLNFLVQEMNREVNTIGSKSSATEIAHLVVGMKEELEKIREQIQNVE